MKKVLILIAVLLLVAVSAQAQTVKSTYSPTYRWYGFEVYGDRFVHPGVETQLGEVDVGVTSHVEDSDNDLKQSDTKVGYTLPLSDQLKFRTGYGYSVLPGVDVQEVSGTIALPGTISPRYTIVHVMPDVADTEGQIHIIGVDVGIGDFTDPNAITAVLSAQAIYNDEVNPFGTTVIEDWTHAEAALVVNVPMGDMILQPSVMYQHTFEEIVESDKNDCWYGVGIQYRF